jgi:hypothetical protein
MIIVREHFIAKPGQAGKLAKMMVEVMKITGSKTRVMTDLVGNFNCVVMETEAENLAEFEKRMEEYMKRTDLGEVMKGYTDMYLTGGREVYKVVG